MARSDFTLRPLPERRSSDSVRARAGTRQLNQSGGSWQPGRTRGGRNAGRAAGWSRYRRVEGSCATAAPRKARNWLRRTGDIAGRRARRARPSRQLPEPRIVRGRARCELALVEERLEERSCRDPTRSGLGLRRTVPPPSSRCPGACRDRRQRPSSLALDKGKRLTDLIAYLTLADDLRCPAAPRAPAF